MRNKKIAKKTLAPRILRDFEPMLREIQLAHRRLDHEGRAHWLLRFAYTNLDELSSGGLSDAKFDVIAFGLPVNPADLKGDALTDARALLDALTREDDLVVEFQKALRSRFDQAKEGRDWEWAYPQQEKSFQLFVKEKSAPGFGGRGRLLPGAVDHLMSVATDLLEHERDRFGICENPRCGRPFVAQRTGNIKFCSPRCSAYVRVNRAREKRES